MSIQILLATLNAKYHHSSFGLRYLYANLGELQDRTAIAEFTTSQGSRDIVESILSKKPKIVGFGIYIWNTHQTYEVISILKRICPEIIIVLGGPEVSYEAENQAICQAADFTIQGEADFAFYHFCRSYFEDGTLPSSKWIRSELPDIKKIALPYAQYSDEDIRHRVLYVEASRGCPYKCEYCLSSLDKSVRNFDLDQFLSSMDELIQRGAKQFKFVDRTFNLSIPTSSRILQFFLDRMNHGLFLHFELVPDRLPIELRDLIKKFPKGSLQFEIGIQTWNPEVAKNVSRRQDYKKIQENFKFLTSETGVHIHADLIAGLPGETFESFAFGFDSVAGMGSSEIQVGILKRLKGTPIIRHDQQFQMVYQEQSPFQILKNCDIDFDTMQKLGRFSQFWDLYSNSGNFKNTMNFFKNGFSPDTQSSLFSEFYTFTLYLTKRHPQGNGIALIHLVESVWVYLSEKYPDKIEVLREALIQDYTGYVKRDIPKFLRTDLNLSPSKKKISDVNLDSQLIQLATKAKSHIPSRQSRHMEERGIDVI